MLCCSFTNDTQIYDTQTLTYHKKKKKKHSTKKDPSFCSFDSLSIVDFVKNPKETKKHAENSMQCILSRKKSRQIFRTKKPHDNKAHVVPFSKKKSGKKQKG